MGDVNDGIEHRPRTLEGRIQKLEGEMIGVKSFQNRIDMDFYNHGRDGLYTRFTKFIARHEERAIQREKEERRHHRRMGIIVTVGTALIATILTWGLSLIVPAAKAVLDDYYQNHPHAQVVRPQSEKSDLVYAQKQSDNQTANGD